jgi:hypothetical protein
VEATESDEVETAALLISDQAASHGCELISLQWLVDVIGIPGLKNETWGTPRQWRVCFARLTPTGL